MLTQDLVVIEAPGKLRQLHRLLDAIGLRATCIATLGHVLESPPHLRPLEIQRDAFGHYHETRRVVARADAHARLSEELRNLRGRLFIATDDDQEGHAIAADVAALARQLRPEIAPLRVLAAALTEPAFRSALALAQPLAPEHAMPAIARRIADRTLAATFSRPEEGIVVGRVTAALAGLARDGAFPTRLVTLQVPAQDGHTAFRAQAYVRDEAAAQAMVEAAAQAPPMPCRGPAEQRPLGAPPTHATFLAAMGECGRLSLSQAAQLLQGLYEDGVVSYPRTDGQHYRAQTRARISRIARSHGVRVANDVSAPPGAGQAHEPLHVLDEKAIEKINLSVPASLQRDDRSAALAWISRQMIASMVTVQRQSGDPRGLPAALAGMEWSRDRGAVPAWHHRPRPGVRPLTQQQSLLQGMVAAGIGRPSTYVGHAVRAVERGVVTADNSLGPEGSRVLAAAPDTLAHAPVARAIERGCDQARTLGVGPTVDQLLAFAVGRRSELMGQVAKLLESTALEEPADAFTP